MAMDIYTLEAKGFPDHTCKLLVVKIQLNIVCQHRGHPSCS